jgi:hypothetical protein
MVKIANAATSLNKDSDSAKKLEFVGQFGRAKDSRNGDWIGCNDH